MAEEGKFNCKMIVRQVGGVLKASTEISFKSFVSILSGYGNRQPAQKECVIPMVDVADTIKEFGGIAIKFFIKSNLVESRSAKADSSAIPLKASAALG